MKKKKKKKAPWNNTPWPTRVSLVSVFFGTEKPPIIWLGLPFFFFASSSLFFLFHSSAFFFSFLRPLLRLHRLRLGTTSSYRRGRNADRLLFLFDFFFWVLKKKNLRRHNGTGRTTTSQSAAASVIAGHTVVARLLIADFEIQQQQQHQQQHQQQQQQQPANTTFPGRKKNYVSIRLRWAETHLDLAKPFLTW